MTQVPTLAEIAERAAAERGRKPDGPREAACQAARRSRCAAQPAAQAASTHALEPHEVRDAMGLSAPPRPGRRVYVVECARCHEREEVEYPEGVPPGTYSGGPIHCARCARALERAAAELARETAEARRERPVRSFVDTEEYARIRREQEEEARCTPSPAPGDAPAATACTPASPASGASTSRAASEQPESETSGSGETSSFGAASGATSAEAAEPLLPEPTPTEDAPMPTAAPAAAPARSAHADARRLDPPWTCPCGMIETDWAPAKAAHEKVCDGTPRPCVHAGPDGAMCPNCLARTRYAAKKGGRALPPALARGARQPQSDTCACGASRLNAKGQRAPRGMCWPCYWKDRRDAERQGSPAAERHVTPREERVMQAAVAAQADRRAARAIGSDLGSLAAGIGGEQGAILAAVAARVEEQTREAEAEPRCNDCGGERARRANGRRPPAGKCWRCYDRDQRRAYDLAHGIVNHRRRANSAAARAPEASTPLPPEHPEAPPAIAAPEVAERVVVLPVAAHAAAPLSTEPHDPRCGCPDLACVARRAHTRAEEVRVEHAARVAAGERVATLEEVVAARAKCSPGIAVNARASDSPRLRAPRPHAVRRLLDATLACAAAAVVRASGEERVARARQAAEIARAVERVAEIEAGIATNGGPR